MSNQNQNGITILNFKRMNDAQENGHCETAFARPVVSYETNAAHPNGLNPANVIYPNHNNDGRHSTSIKPDTSYATNKNPNVNRGTAYVHPFVANGTTADHSDNFNPANVIFSKPNNDVKLPIPIKLDNTEKNASQDSKTAPAPETDPDPWTLKKICVTYAMGTSNHGIANANRLWVAGYRYCGVALIIWSSFVPSFGFLFGFLGMRDMLRPTYSATSITVVNDRQPGLALPRILMSNAAYFNYSALEHHNVSLYEASLITTLLVGKFAYTRTLERNIDKVNKDYHNLLHRLNTSANGIWNLLSYKCDEIIIDCLLNTKHIPGPTCCKEHFDTVLGSFGLSFMSKTTFIQERGKVAAGLTLSVRVPVKTLALDWNYMNRGATLLKTGLRVSIIDNNKDYSTSTGSVVPVHGLDRILVTVSYDHYDNTGMHHSLFPWWDASADCTPPDAPYQVLASIEGKCVSSSLHVCAQRLRNCSFVSYPFLNGTERFCDFEDQHALTHSAEAVICRSEHVAKCANLCEEDVYSFSAQSFPLTQFNEMPEKYMNSTWAVEGAFTMFYTHLEHTVYAQSRTNMVLLFSSLGGTMSLFMGASLISIGELIACISGIIIWTLLRISKRFPVRGCFCNTRSRRLDFQ